MTVADLRALLTHLPDDMPVVVMADGGYIQGPEPVAEVTEVKLIFPRVGDPRTKVTALVIYDFEDH